MKKHLGPGESHYYRPKFTTQTVFVDYRQLDGTLLGAWATDEADAEAWIAAKRAADRPKETIDYTAVATQRERREQTHV